MPEQEPLILPSTEAIVEALRASRRHLIQSWMAGFTQHRRCPTFHIQDDPFQMRYGYSCSCSGVEVIQYMELRTIREQLPEVRESVQRLRARALARKSYQARKALKKARVLLFGFLSRQQKQELRAYQHFTMRGRDGRTYQIREQSANNVRVLEEGVVTHSLCVVFCEDIPLHDLMLAQKLRLEANPEAFWKQAVVQNMAEPPISIVEPEPAQVERLNIPDEVLDDPGSWVRERVQSLLGVDGSEAPP